MAGLKRFFQRTLALLPALLLAASWPALWLAWPRGESTDLARRAAASTCRARYVSGEERKLAVYLRPDLFGRGSDGNASESAVDTHSDASAVMTVTRPAQTLSWDAEEGHHRLPVDATTSAEMAVRALHGLVVAEASEPVFPPVSASGFRLVASAGRRLAAAGFQLPEDLPEELEETDEPWSARLWVELGDRDAMGHVLIEKGTGRANLDRALVGVVAGLLPARGYAGVSGWVTVEYGRY